MKIVVGPEDFTKSGQRRRKPELRHLKPEILAAAFAAEIVVFDVLYEDMRHGLRMGQVFLKKPADHPGPLAEVLKQIAAGRKRKGGKM